jgi:hypothetical protein
MRPRSPVSLLLHSSCTVERWLILSSSIRQVSTGPGDAPESTELQLRTRWTHATRCSAPKPTDERWNRETDGDCVIGVAT